jgi:hypothetical protein
MTLEIQITFDEAQIEKLLKIPLLMRLGPAERVLKAMAKPVIERAKSIAPSSKRSGTRKKMGKNVTDKFVGKAANTVDDSGKHIGMKYIKTERGGLMIVGGKYPRANKQNYEAGDKRKIVYWGKKTSKIKRINPSERFMQKAFDETKPQQITAGNEQLTKEMKELSLG